LEKKLTKASKLNALGLMAGAVAHDLNNILTAVVSYPELLMMQMDEQDKYYREIQKIQHAGKQAAAIVSDLVSIARGGLRKKTVANLNTIIQEYLDSIGHSESLQASPNTVVQTFLQSDLHNIECSVTHIHKVLLNLVGNALEAIGDGGMVTIQTENYTLLESIEADLFVMPPGEYVQLTVSDNGPGIDPTKIEQIFTPFYTTKEKGKGGTGLGLSIVWNIIQEHKGWIDVQRLNPGTAFIVYIPSSKSKINLRRSSAFDHSLIGNNEKVLIVDDQPEQNEVVAKILTTLGYRSHSVTSGEEAVVYLQKNSVDLVILDMLMGDGMNGRQTYEKILELNPEQKAIVVSGYCGVEELEKAKSLGITVFLQKPIAIETLGRELQRVLVKN
jgi:CheY-like chemotaxis protein